MPLNDTAMMAQHAAAMLSHNGRGGPVSYTNSDVAAGAATAGGRLGLGGGARLVGGTSSNAAKDAGVCGKVGLHDTASDDVIVIHVCDDNRRINRDFYCSRELLLAHMAYFTPYLANVRALLLLNPPK